MHPKNTSCLGAFRMRVRNMVCQISARSESSSILAITSQLPWPLNTGGHLRTFHMLRALAKRFRVRLITGAPEGSEEGAVALAREGVRVFAVRVGPRRTWREGLRALAAALRRQPYVLYQRHNRREIRITLDEELQRERPDIVYLDHLDSAVFLRQFSGIPVVLDLHNVYSLLVRREAQDRGRIMGLYLGREGRLLGQAEQRIARRIDILFSVSEQEAEHFRSLGARTVHVVPNGVDCGTYEALPIGRREGTPRILCVGAMSWAPNASAARFLATRILPRVRERFPMAELCIVGKDPPCDLAALDGRAGVRVTGEVPSMLPYLREAHVLAVPLKAGGGTRTKILEAFAAGLPVISTAVGCEGLRVVSGEHLLVRERDDFAEALTTLLSRPAAGQALADRGRQLARRLYDWSTIGGVASAAIDGMVRSPTGTGLRVR
jgi:polysaccharide biosynthesis protein PslH